MKWLGTIMPALPNEEPRCARARSITVTRCPRRRHSCAALKPMSPPPMTTTCFARGLMSLGRYFPVVPAALAASLRAFTFALMAAFAFLSRSGQTKVGARAGS